MLANSLCHMQCTQPVQPHVQHVLTPGCTVQAAPRPSTRCTLPAVHRGVCDMRSRVQTTCGSLDQPPVLPTVLDLAQHRKQCTIPFKPQPAVHRQDPALHWLLRESVLVWPKDLQGQMFLIQFKGYVCSKCFSGPLRCLSLPMSWAVLLFNRARNRIYA